MTRSLGVDVGTGSVKAAIVHHSESPMVAELVRSASQSYSVSSPQPGWAEMDPLQWEEATRSVLHELASDGDADLAVGWSGQMHGVVLTDDSLVPLRPAITWADSRSAAQAQRMARELPSDLIANLGSVPVAGFSATTLAWLCEYEPDVVRSARWILQPKDWLRARLGGDVCTDASDASGTLMMDVRTRQWSLEVVEWLGIDALQLPPIRTGDAAGGTVDVLGHSLATVVGGADTACVLEALGLREHEGFVAVGSGAQVVQASRSSSVSAGTHTFARARGDEWYRIGAVQNAGLALTRALQWFGATADEANAALDSGVQPHDPIFIPYIAGERTPFMNADLRGAWAEIGVHTDRTAMLRSVLEGMASAVALAVDAVTVNAPFREPVPLVGGGTQDSRFRQLLTDATGLSLQPADVPDAAVIGAALLTAPAGPHASLGSTTPTSVNATTRSLLLERRARMVTHLLSMTADAF